MISRFIRRTANKAQLGRYFASEVATQEAGDAAAGGISHYVDGQLVRRNTLVLKKSEDIEGYVVGIVQDYFRSTNKQAITIDSSLEDHGLDSLDSIELAMRLEEDLGYVISAETLPVLNSVRHFVNYIEQVEGFKEQNGQGPLQ